MVALKTILPKQSTIIGQSIEKDLRWLGLEAPRDIAGSFDVAHLFRERNPPQSSSAYRNYGLKHVAKCLMAESIQECDHDPVIDAKYALRVFHQFRHIHENPFHLRAIRESLRKSPKTTPFWVSCPYIDGVSLSAQATNQRTSVAQVEAVNQHVTR